MKRTFVIGQAILKGKKSKGVSIPKGSVYKSSTPVSAAIKGFNDICKKNKKKEFCNVVVSVKDITLMENLMGKNTTIRSKEYTSPIQSM